MTAGLFLGLESKVATDYSFLLVTPLAEREWSLFEVALGTEVGLPGEGDQPSCWIRWV